MLCADKTGTLTRNALTVTTVLPMPGFDDRHVLALAAPASAEGGQDPVDTAIRASAASSVAADAPKLLKFTAFDPAKKMSRFFDVAIHDSSGKEQDVRQRERHGLGVQVHGGGWCMNWRPAPTTNVSPSLCNGVASIFSTGKLPKRVC